jgi:hypothetical protein
MDNLGLPTTTKVSNSLPTINDVPVAPQTDRVQPRQVASGTTRGVQQLGGPNIYADAPNSRHVVTDGTVDRVWLGKIGDGADDWGLKVSEPSIDVASATDDQLLFDSSRNSFKIVSTDTISFAVGSLVSGATTTQTVPHGLTTIPAVMAFVNGTGSTYLVANQHYSVPVTIPVAVGGKYEAGVNYSFRVDSMNMYFDVSNYSSASPLTDIGTASFKYYVLQQTAN